MKSKFAVFFLNIAAIVLALGISIIGIIVYFGEFTPNTEKSTSYVVDQIAIEKPKETNKDQNESVASENMAAIQIESTQSTSANIDENTKEWDNINSQSMNDYFYYQLNENQKIIYDKLKENKENLKKGNYIVDFGDTFTSTLEMQNGSQILGRDYQTAIEAFTHDYVDLFYIDVNKMILNIETTTMLFKSTYKVYISPKEGETYLSDDFTSEYQVQLTSASIERVKDTILRNISGTEYEKILYIHDYLVNNIDYDSSYTAIGSYDIYGALVEQKCVCEGYAKAFKYLANAAGIRCEIMQGTATNSIGTTESHAWNCVKLDGNWYEIDCTWDDPIINGGGTVSEDIKYRYFLKGADLFDIDHVNSYQFSDGGKVFAYPPINRINYQK